MRQVVEKGVVLGMPFKGEVLLDAIVEGPHRRELGRCELTDSEYKDYRDACWGLYCLERKGVLV